MLRTKISGSLKNEDYELPHLLKMNIVFSKLLKTEDLKTIHKNVRKMKTMSCAGSPMSTSGNSSEKLYCGNVVNIPYLKTTVTPSQLNHKHKKGGKTKWPHICVCVCNHIEAHSTNYLFYRGTDLKMIIPI